MFNTSMPSDSSFKLLFVDLKSDCILRTRTSNIPAFVLMTIQAFILNGDLSFFKYESRHIFGINLDDILHMWFWWASESEGFRLKLWEFQIEITRTTNIGLLCRNFDSQKGTQTVQNVIIIKT